MKKIIFFSLVASLICLTRYAVSAENDGWVKALEKKDITVYTRPVEGSSFKEFKGTTTINAPLQVVLAVINDIESYPQWMSDCKEAELIESISKVEKIAYIGQKLPWPVKNRDVVTLSKTKDNLSREGDVIIHFSAIQDQRKPENKHYIRMASMDGEWVLSVASPDKTNIVYRIKADPAGSIPATIANMTSKKIPYETLLGLKKMVKKDKYIKKSAPKTTK